MTDTAKKIHKPRTKQLDFASFALGISIKAIEKYGTSYMTYKEVKNAWRTKIPYSVAAEDDLILWTKTYIRGIQNKNLSYLFPMVKDIADYLAKFTAQKYTTQEKEGRPVRKYEFSRLKSILWDENPYIKNLIEDNKKRQNLQHKPGAVKQERMKRKQQKINNQKKYDADIHNQVQSLFAEARTYRGM